MKGAGRARVPTGMGSCVLAFGCLQCGILESSDAVGTVYTAHHFGKQPKGKA